MTDRPIGFAHRGGKADAPENTLEAFRKALVNGATGLESDVLLSKDGLAVLAHDKTFWTSWPPARRHVNRTDRSVLPAHVPSLDDLYQMSDAVDVFLDVKDIGAISEVVGSAMSAGVSKRLWLAHESHKSSDRDVVASWRELNADVRLVDSSNMKRLGDGFPAYVASSARLGIAAMNMPAHDWNRARVETCRAHGLLCFAFRAHSKRALRHAVSLGVDAVFSDHVERMMKTIAAYGSSSSE